MRGCRLADTCFKKCVSSDYKDTELNKGESVCLDRCVHKFVESFQKVSRRPPLPEVLAGREWRLTVHTQVATQMNEKTTKMQEGR